MQVRRGSEEDGWSDIQRFINLNTSIDTLNVKIDLQLTPKHNYEHYFKQ